MGPTVTFALAVLLLYGAQGSIGYNLWVSLTLLDSLRALKTVRVNGRRIGIVTRRKAIRQCVVCWVILVSVQPAAFLADVFLSWIPFYASLKTLVVLICLTWRLQTSAFILQTFVIPFIRRYEVDIDLFLSLLESAVQLIWHYAFHSPWQLATSVIRRLCYSSGALGDAPSSPRTSPPQSFIIRRPSAASSSSSDGEDRRAAMDSDGYIDTPSKSARSTVRTARTTQASERRSPRRPSPSSPRPRRPRSGTTNDVPSKVTRVAKPAATREPRLPKSQHARATTSSALDKPRRTANDKAKPRGDPAPGRQATAAAPSRGHATAAAHASALDRRQAQAEAVRSAAAAAALSALPPPPASDLIGDHAREAAGSEITTSVHELPADRTESGSRKRVRRDGNDGNGPAKRATTRSTKETTRSSRSKTVADAPAKRATTTTGVAGAASGSKRGITTTGVAASATSTKRKRTAPAAPANEPVPRTKRLRSSNQ